MDFVQHVEKTIPNAFRARVEYIKGRYNPMQARLVSLRRSYVAESTAALLANGDFKEIHVGIVKE